MKIKQLYRTVCLLGFGMTGEKVPKEDFLAALSMAVDTLAAASPLIEQKIIEKRDVAAYVGGLTAFDCTSYEGKMMYDIAVAESGGAMARVFCYDGRIYVPSYLVKQTAPLVLRYIRKPSHADLDSFEANCEVDVTAEAEHLLPYLTAAIVWADSEPELSAQYREYFNTHIKELCTLGSEKRGMCGIGVTYSSPWLPDAR